MFYIGQLIGGFVAIFLVSRLFWLVARRWPNSIGKVITLDLTTGLLGSLLGAIGGADGGPPNLAAFTVYLPAAALVVVLDLIRIRKA